MVEDRKAREAVEETDKTTAPAAAKHPAAGPHAKDHLTDHDKTPGTGSLPGRDAHEADAGPD
jgi:hypothetical protein